MEGKEYYNHGLEKGIDLNFYGDWQRNYAKLVVFVTNAYKEQPKEKLSLLDVGTCCGVNLIAFKETDVFSRIIGTDINQYLIDLGKETHGFTNKEMIVAPAWEQPFDDESFDFIHCSQVLEHIEEENIPLVIGEFERLLKPNGTLFITLNAISNKNNPAEQDVTHITNKTIFWWKKQFSKLKQFKDISKEVNENFKVAQMRPNNDENQKFDRNKVIKNFYYFYKDQWTIFSYVKI